MCVFFANVVFSVHVVYCTITHTEKFSFGMIIIIRYCQHIFISLSGYVLSQYLSFIFVNFKY